uniref:Integrase catalytic domain-containing protein n=1 Tax=Fagus sylvatica TaxID=28930 RepID=A0A2N9HK34_FAGSY
MSSSSSSSTTDAISPTQPRYTPLLTPSNHLQIKLTKDNYLSWKTAIIPYINGNKILHYIDGTTAAPPQHIPSPTSSTTLIPNPAFTSWFEIDQLLLSILVSTISESLVPSLVGRSSSRDVWLTLEKMFSSQSRARVMQTRYHLAMLKKGNMSIPDYFQKAKSYADLLASIGQPLHDNDLITQILAGLPSDYNDLVTSINTRLEDMPIDELFGHLLTHELRLEQQATVPDLGIPMANLAAKTFNSSTQGRPHQYSSNRGSNGSRGRGRNNYSRNRSNGGPSSSFPNSNNGSKSASRWVILPLLVGIGLSNNMKHLWLLNLLHKPLLQPHHPPLIRHLNKFFSTLGISHCRSCPHTHQQNGSVERKHRHIVETGLTLLATASVPFSYWDEAFLTSAYLINCLPSPVTKNKSPLEILYHKTPDYNFLKTFGYACWPHLRPYNTHKFDFRSKRCVFLGYSLNHKGYKCLDLSTNRMYIARNVVFDEHTFPFSTNSIPSPSGPHSSPSISIPSLPNYTPTTTPSPQNSDSTSSINPNDPTPLPPSDITSPSHPLPHVSSSPISTQCPPSPAHDLSLQPTAASNPHVSSPTIIPMSPNPPANTLNLHTNTHPMHTRSRDNIVQPKQFYPGVIRYPLPKALLTVTNSLPPEPSCFTEAYKSAEWRAAMDTELIALLRNSTWSLVQPKPNTNVVGCKWVFRIKRNAAGTIERYKARLVAKGFHQLHGVDYGDTFSPVIKPVTIRTVLSLVVASNWDIRQLDVTNAFLHGVLSEDVYMSQPPGCKFDTSLFIHSSSPDLILFLIYVDDIIITGPNSVSITRLINTLQGDFALKDLGPLHFFLGVEAHKVDSGMYLSQRRYITDLLHKTNLHEAKPVSSPMASSTVLSQYTGSSLSDPSSYRSVVGSLQYLSLTRPDISFAVNKVCQFMANPTEDHWSAVKRILRYLKHTIHHCIFLHRDTNFNIQAFSDADWVSCPDDRRSTTGYCLLLGRNLISWTSRKQRTVSRSSTESEYRAVAHASTEIIWLRSFLSELGLVSSTPPLLWCDNIGATYLTANPLFMPVPNILKLMFTLFVIW